MGLLRTTRSWVMVCLALNAITCLTAADGSLYRSSIEAWRRYYAARIKSDDGWLTVAELFGIWRAARKPIRRQRFLDVDASSNGTFVVDFNKVYNRPCAYNPYTTCPLPPLGNRLRMEIGAGERIYKRERMYDAVMRSPTFECRNCYGKAFNRAGRLMCSSVLFGATPGDLGRV